MLLEKNNDSLAKTTQNKGVIKMLNGVDISSYQAGINSFGSDVDFVICKATEGIGYVDKYCDALYQRAKRDGKLLGVYHFARPGYMGNTAEGEAEWFVKNIKGYINEAILILDWESENKNDVDYAKRFLDKVYELTGVRPLFYSYTSIINQYDWKPIADANYGLWVAQYGIDNGQPQQQPIVNNWKFYAMWQYTSKGRISGYGLNIDKDIFYGDRETWLKYAKSTKKDEDEEKPQPQPEPEPQKPSKSIEEVALEVINGVYGIKEERKRKLAEAGYNPTEVQNKVNELYNLADEIKNGKWGNGKERKDKLAQAGYNPTIVQAVVNKIMEENNNTPKEIVYTVKSGDNLTAIGKKYNVDWKTIAEKNGIKGPKYVIYPGQKLKI